MGSVPVLSIENLHVEFTQRRATVAAVRDLCLKVDSSQSIGVVGESGSGKTQAFMAAMGLLASNARTRGSIRFDGAELLNAGSSVLNRLRGSKLAMIFQDPMTSLTPHLRIGSQLAEVLVQHRGLSWKDAGIHAGRMLERVRMPEPRRQLRQFPHELSGGMRQRVMIAMSLLCDPDLVIADEPTTALDVTVQAQIIDLLCAMRTELGMALVLISHDLAVVAGVAQRIVVMYAGRIVESAQTEQLFRRPRHPYTAELLRCLPTLSSPRLPRMATLTGQSPRADETPPGCDFAPRCPRAAQRCRIERPLLDGLDHMAACHFPLV